MKNKSMALQPPKTYLKQEQKNKKNEHKEEVYIRYDKKQGDKNASHDGS